jgi:TonB family protein
MLEGWQVDRLDVPRARRLAAGACVGLALLGSLGFAATRVKAAPAPAPAPPEEEDIPVALVESPDEPPPPPEPNEAPAERPSPGPRRPAMAASPTRIPEGAKQADAGEDPYGNAPLPEPGAQSGGGGAGTGPALPRTAPPPPPKRPPPPAPKAAPSPADYEPPKCKLASPDRAQAKALGVEGTVVVKYTVTEGGAIVNANVTKGPPELAGLALAAIAASRCEPARMKSDGSPVSVTRTVRYPIRFTAN